MADTSRTIKVIFDGSVAGVVAAAAIARKAISAVNDDNTKFGKKFEEVSSKFANFTGQFLKFAGIAGAGSSAILTAASATSVLVTTVAALAPGVLALPGLLLGAGAAYGVFKLATDGVSKALSGNQKAYEKLLPAAKAFVDTVRSFKPAFDDIRNAVQQEFFKGFNEQLKLTGSVLLPVLREQLPVIAQGFNGIGIEAIKAAGTPFFTGAVKSILANTGTAMGNLRNTLANVMTGFVGLGTVGAQYLPRIATAIDHVAERFKNWVTTGLETGTIKAFVDKAIATFKQLEEVVKNVGSILVEIFKGLNSGLGAGGALDGVVKTTAAIKEFLKTAAAQSALKSLGETVRALADAFRGVLMEALKQIAGIIPQLLPFLKQFATALGGDLITALKIAGPVLQTLAGIMSAFPGISSQVVIGLLAIGPVTKVFGLLFGAIGKTGKALGSLARFAGHVGDAFHILLSVFGGLSGIAASVGGFFSGIGEAIAAVIGVMGGFSGIFSGLVTVVETAAVAIGGALSSPVVIVAAVIAAVVGLFTLAYNKIAGFKSFVDSAVSGIGSFFSTAFSAVVDFFANFGTNLSKISSSIGTFFSELPSKIGSALSGGSSAVLEFFNTLPDRIVIALFTLIGHIAGIAWAAWNGFYNFTVTGWQTIITFVTGLPAQIGAALSTFGSFLATTATTAWNAFYTATVSVVTTVVAFVQALPGRIIAFLSALPGQLTTLATNAWNAFKTATTNVVSAVIAFVQTVPGKATSALSSLVSQLGSIATNAWNSFKTATQNGINAVLTFFRNLPGQIVSALSGLAGQMLTIGRNIVNGIISGITGAASALMARIRNLASEALSAATSAFQQHSPSRLFIPVGFNVGAGIGVGVDNSVRLIAERIRAMATAALAAAKGSGLARLADMFTGNSALSVTSSNIASIVPGVADSAPAKPDLHTTLADAIKAAFAALPPIVNHLNLNTNDKALRDFIQLETDKIHDEVARRVGAGAGVSFG